MGRQQTGWVAAWGVAIALVTGSACESDTRPTPIQTAAPVIGLVSPFQGLSTEATPIRITGSGFQSGATVRIGGVLTPAVVESPTTIAASAPPRDIGEVDLVVTNPDGRSGRLARAFTYVPTTSRPAGSTHSVSWTAGEVCPVIPAEARQRRYDATIENGLVTLRTGTFLDGSICTFGTGLGCHQFRLDQMGDDVRVLIRNPDDWHGGEIVERLPSGGWLSLTGEGSGRVDGTTIRASVNANLWYCPGNQSSPFPCNNYVACSVPNLELTITGYQTVTGYRR